jgi:hypothetical protein
MHAGLPDAFSVSKTRNLELKRVHLQAEKGVNADHQLVLSLARR